MQQDLSEELLLASFNTCPIFKYPLQTQEGSQYHSPTFYRQLASKNTVSGKYTLVSVASARQIGGKKAVIVFLIFSWCMNVLGILCCHGRNCLILKKIWNRQDHRNGERISDKFIQVGQQRGGIGHFLPSEMAVCCLTHLPS